MLQCPHVESKLYRRLWGPVRRLESLQPHAKPRQHYSVPVSESDRFIFVRIRGGFHEIRSSICDAVVIARLLNATLVVPEIQSTTSNKGISAQFKSFAYLYSEDQFMTALANDITVVKTLPKTLKGARRKKEIPSFKVVNSQSPYYYLHHVLPVLKRHSVVELVVSDGGCLQAILPPDLEKYQRLRCRVAFHALSFRQEVQELATKILHRSRTAVAPLERLKILLLVQNPHAIKYNGTIQGLKYIWRTEGFRGLFKGNGTNCARIVPNSAVKFFSYEEASKGILWLYRQQPGNEDAELTPVLRLGAGACAGIIAMSILH